jgi:hypothetical protein
LVPSIKSLRQSILDLSTRDDSVKENADKTYRFYEFINALSEVHFKTRLADKASPYLFFTLMND